MADGVLDGIKGGGAKAGAAVVSGAAVGALTLPIFGWVVAALMTLHFVGDSGKK